MIQRLAKAIRGVVKCELLFWKVYMYIFAPTQLSQVAQPGYEEMFLQE